MQLLGKGKLLCNLLVHSVVARFSRMSRSEAHEVLRRAVSRSESQEGLHQTEFESQEDIRLAADRYQDQPAPPRKRKTSKVLLEAFGVSCQVEFTTAAEVAPLNPLADSQGPEAAAVAEGAVVAITIASARPHGPGGPAQAYHYRQPLANTKEATVVPPRGMGASIGLRVRRLRDGCSKLCFSPIGAVLVICCFSLLICVAEIFSPPPFGINTGANGAECNATGFGPMPVCICVPPSATRSSSTLLLLGNSLCYPVVWACPDPALLPINSNFPCAQARVRQCVSRTSRA